MRDRDAAAAFIEARRAQPFAWGRRGNDCGSFAAAAVKAQTGKDPLARLSSHWTGKTGALRVIYRHGGLEAVVDRLLTPISPAMAGRGDIALVGVGDDVALMVVEGDTLAGPGPAGVERLPRSAMIRAWSAG